MDVDDAMIQGAGLLIVTPFDCAVAACPACQRLTEMADDLQFKVVSRYVVTPKEIGQSLIQLVADVKAGKVVLILAESADMLLKDTELTQVVRDEPQAGVLHIVTLDGVSTFKGLGEVARYDWGIK